MNDSYISQHNDYTNESLALDLLIYRLHFRYELSVDGLHIFEHSPQRKFILEIYLKTKSYKKVRQLFIKDKMAIIFNIYCNFFFKH